jgi:hypothetical protein
MMKVPISPLQNATKGDVPIFTPTEREKNEMQEKINNGN